MIDPTRAARLLTVAVFLLTACGGSDEEGSSSSSGGGGSSSSSGGSGEPEGPQVRMVTWWPETLDRHEFYVHGTSRTPQVRFPFSELMDVESVIHAVTVTDPQGEPVPVAVQDGPGPSSNRRFWVTPKQPLAPMAGQYEVVIDTTAKDLEGRPLRERWEGGFTTEESRWRSNRGRVGVSGEEVHFDHTASMWGVRGSGESAELMDVVVDDNNGLLGALGVENFSRFVRWTVEDRFEIVQVPNSPRPSFSCRGHTTGQGDRPHSNLGMGDNGIALVATTSAVARDGLFCGRVRVSLYDFESEQFQEPHWFEFPDSRVSDVRVHAFRGGRYHIIWKESPASQSPSRPPQRLHSAAYDPQSGWSEPIEIVTAPKSSMGRHSHIGDVDAAATRDGYLTVTWERFRNVTDDAEGIIHVAEFIPELGEWSEPEIVAQGVYDNRVRNVFRPRIEVSNSGWRLVTWQTLVEPRGVVWARTRLPGGEWSASVRVNPPDRPLISGDGGPHEYAIAMNPHGDAVAVWATPSSPQTHGELWGRRLPANGEWSPQVVKLARNRKQTDSQEGDAVTHASVTVHISEGGRVHAALPGLSDTTCLSYWGVADSQPTVDCDLMSVPAASESPVPSRVLFREGPNETKRAFTTRHQASGTRGTSHGLVGFGFW